MNSVLESLKKHTLKFLAVGIVLLFVGPEIIAGAELIGLVELVGVDIFILMYWHIALDFCRKLLDRLVRFERKFGNPCFGIWISSENCYQNISHLFFPERTLNNVFFFFAIVSIGNFSYQSIIIPLLGG